MKAGDLVRSTVDSTVGIILDLGNRYWDGIQWTFAHVQVSWHPCNGKIKWQTTDLLEVIHESR